MVSDGEGKKLNKKYQLFFLGLLVLGLGILATHYLMNNGIAVLNPQGPVAAKERSLIVCTLGLSLIVVIPVFIMTIVIALRYREGNTKAKYSPDLDHNLAAETTWWLIPTALIVVLSVVAWRSSHSLDPARALTSQNSPMTIQVVAMDWKWLFIYPQQNIATVNLVQFPVNTPINFEITSDAPMNSFWIPQLGGQIYAMAGMTTHLHLQASQVGDFRGSSANISGMGFAGMDFTARSSSQADFSHWTQMVKSSSSSLGLGDYNSLAQPSTNNPVTYYSSSQSGLYDGIITKYMMPGMGGEM